MKNILVILFLVSIFLVGCSSTVTDQTDTGNVPEPTGGVPGVARSFSASTINSGDTVTVTLTKNLDKGQTVLLVEENVPSGWVIVDAGTGNVVGNTIRWAELTGASSGKYVYAVKAGDSGTWTGQYSINGEETLNIGGSTEVVVI